MEATQREYREFLTGALRKSNLGWIADEIDTELRAPPIDDDHSIHPKQAPDQGDSAAGKELVDREGSRSHMKTTRTEGEKLEAAIRITLQYLSLGPALLKETIKSADDNFGVDVGFVGQMDGKKVILNPAMNERLDALIETLVADLLRVADDCKLNLHGLRRVSGRNTRVEG